MKIIAGKFKGRNLEYRTRRGLRVTSQKVKEAIFSILGSSINNARVMDLYCGYGSLGLEAISRGASHVTFVDVDSGALKQLKFFLDKLGIVDQATVIKRDAVKAVKQGTPESLDLVLMDPPYHVKFEIKTLEAIDKADLIKPGGIAVVEHYAENKLPEQVGRFTLRKVKTYGDTAVSIYLLPGGDNDGRLTPEQEECAGEDASADKESPDSPGN